MLERLFGPGASSTLIEAAFEDLSDMLNQSARMLDIALRAVLENQPLEADLERMDDAVDENERMVRRSVLEHLVVDPRHQLVPSLVLASIIQDAERLGDFARGLGELAALAKSPRQGPFRQALREISTELRPLFDLCNRAIRSDDPQAARGVMAAHRRLKDQLKEMVAQVAESDLSADLAVVYSGAARILSRISAHLSNIASSVVHPYDKIRSGDEEV